MNYTDVALTGDQISELKKGYKKTAWRVKALKATGKKLPDSETTNVIKIDTDGSGSKYEYDTFGAGYKKVIHDTERNRTFVLHNRKTSEAGALVSIINHYLGEDHEDFIETLDKDTHADDDLKESNAIYICDMDYDPATQKLAISTLSTSGASAGLFIVSCSKYLPELVTNECGELKPNPDYLSTVFISPGESYLSKGGSYIRFVRRYANRWYVWCRDYATAPGDEYLFYYLGYLTDAGSFKLLMQYGYAPGAAPYAPETWYPTSKPIWHYAEASGDSAWGEPARIFEDVATFDITDSGKLVMATETNGQAFGMKPFITRIDLAEAESGDPLLGTCSISIEGVYDPVSQLYKVPQGTTTTTIELPGARGCVAVSISDSSTGGAADAHPGTTFYFQNRFGTSKQGAFHPDEEVISHISFFAYNETITIGVVNPNLFSSETPFTFVWDFTVRSISAGLEECIGVHSTGGPIAQEGDDVMPETTGEEQYWHTWQIAKVVDPTPALQPMSINSCVYDETLDRYFFAVREPSNRGHGLWVYNAATATGALTRLKPADSGLACMHVGALADVSERHIALVCDDGDRGSQLYNVAVQFLDKSSLAFTDRRYDAAVLWSGAASNSVVYDEKRNVVGMATGAFSSAYYTSFGNSGEIWFWKPETVDGEWTRDPRVWWDGNDPDIIVGDSARAADDLGQGVRLLNPSWSQTKGRSSYRFSFDTRGAAYLPWAESPFNENADLPGSFDGTLQDGTRLFVERGVWDGAEWAWIQEGQMFVMSLPVANTSGDVAMSVTAQGPISMLVTRATYDGFHKPEVATITNGTLTAGEATETEYPYYYEDGENGRITNWAVRPQPAVSVGGEAVANYTVDCFAGAIIFDEEQTDTVAATFDYYVSGTNEAEDIIYCILTYPQEFGGCGLDESYITRKLEGVALSPISDTVYAFPKNNIKADSMTNTVYRNGAPTPATWDYRAGTVTFSGSQAGQTITGDCVYYTIQKGGVTLPPVNLTVRELKDSYHCIDKVCKLVAPNYIFREGRDGRLESDFFTQKQAGEEDIVVDDDDIAVQSFNSNPSYEELATRVISIGSASLEERPNHCLNKEVTDLLGGEAAAYGWSYGWHEPVQVATVTDGNPATGLTSGWGNNDGWGPVKDTLGSVPDGVPLISIDMEQEYEIDTIIVARPSQRSNEGGTNPDDVQSLSVWVCQDNEASEYVRLIEPFKIMPGANVKFMAGTNFDVGTRFRWIRVNLHSIGLYLWKRGLDSQIGISEVQCYPPREILGEARLQNEDPAEDLYDEHGLLDKYGLITHVARSGQPDTDLNSKSKADLDAAYTLKEIVRLMRKVDIRSPWLPGIPVFSTLKVTNAAMGITRTFFVEGRTSGPDGDYYTGSTLP